MFNKYKSIVQFCLIFSFLFSLITHADDIVLISNVNKAFRYKHYDKGDELSFIFKKEKDGRVSFRLYLYDYHNCFSRRRESPYNDCSEWGRVDLPKSMFFREGRDIYFRKKDETIYCGQAATAFKRGKILKECLNIKVLADYYDHDEREWIYKVVHQE